MTEAECDIVVLMWRLLLAWLVACGRAPTKLEAAQQFVGADAVAIRKIIRKPVGSGGLWFADMTCAREFSLPGRIETARLDAFAQCLAGLHVRVGDRKDPLEDVVVLTYAPGIEIEARFINDGDGPWLDWIGFESRRDLRDGLPTISAATLESLRASGARDGSIDVTVGAALLAHAHSFEQESEYAWVKVCLDTTGAVTGAHVRAASSLAAATAFKASALAWTFRPMLIDAQPIPVCTMVVLVYPATKHPATEMLPLPQPDTPQELVELPSVVLGKRLAGQTQLQPSSENRALLDAAGIGRVIVAFQYCIDDTGAVTSVGRIRSSGLPAYDAQIVSAMKEWRYRPYVEPGSVPMPVCSSVTFIYTQGNGTNGPSRKIRRQM